MSTCRVSFIPGNTTSCSFTEGESVLDVLLRNNLMQHVNTNIGKNDWPSNASIQDWQKRCVYGPSDYCGDPANNFGFDLTVLDGDRIFINNGVKGFPRCFPPDKWDYKTKSIVTE